MKKKIGTVSFRKNPAQPRNEKNENFKFTFELPVASNY